MAERIYFYVENQRVRTGSVSFEWFPGFAVSQKQKSIASMHRAIAGTGKIPLEVSTKSPERLGQMLSAFNLKLGGHYLENVFQAGKVFAGGGPYTDLLGVAPRDAKRDERLKSSGKLVGFTYQGTDWPLEPKTAFYDWLYYNAVRESIPADILEELKRYNAFTDIEFNPNKSINTQARSIAIVKLVFDLKKDIPKISKEEFIELHISVF